MNIKKLVTCLILGAVCSAFVPSHMEAREHRYHRCHRSTHVAVGVSACRPVPPPVCYREPVVVRRTYPSTVERVYVSSSPRCTREVVVVEEPYYEEVYVAPRPVPVCPSPLFGFSWNFFSR